jgi:hypothetical protein
VSLAPACLLTDAEPMTNSQVLYYEYDGTEKLSVRENGFESEWRVRIHACRWLAWCSTLPRHSLLLDPPTHVPFLSGNAIMIPPWKTYRKDCALASKRDSPHT